jgi:hypothetical protein
MGGSPATVNPGDYIKRPSMDMEAALLGQKNQIGLMFLKNQADMLKLASNITPQMQEFSPNQVSREAGELGMANLARSRKYEALASPEAAKMRQEVPQRLQAATSREAWKQQMEEWAKTKGIPAISATGIDPDSTIGRSALFDMATQAGRDFELGNIAAQQSYLDAYGAPTGGLDPGALMAGKQAAEVANQEAMGRWQAGLLGAAQGLGMTAADFANTGIGDLLSLSQANRANQQAYQQMLYQGAVQNAAARNAQSAAGIGMLGGLAGAGLTAGAIAF